MLSISSFQPARLPPRFKEYISADTLEPGDIAILRGSPVQVIKTVDPSARDTERSISARMEPVRTKTPTILGPRVEVDFVQVDVAPRQAGQADKPAYTVQAYRGSNTRMVEAKLLRPFVGA